MVTVPVTSDALNVSVQLGVNFKTSSGIPAGSVSNASGATTVTVPVKVGPAFGSAQLDAGQYYFAVQLDAKADGSDTTNFTTYALTPATSATNYVVFYGPHQAVGTATSFTVPFIQVQ